MLKIQARINPHILCESCLVRPDDHIDANPSPDIYRTIQIPHIISSSPSLELHHTCRPHLVQDAMSTRTAPNRLSALQLDFLIAVTAFVCYEAGALVGDDVHGFGACASVGGGLVGHFRVVSF